MKAIQLRWTVWMMVAMALWTGSGIAGPAPTRPPAWVRQHEVGVEGVVHAPGLGDFDVFDYAAGVELEYRYWWTDVCGVGLGIGYERWEAGNGTRNWKGRTDGELGVVPLSALAYLRLADWSVCELTGYGGLEYAWADSDLTLERSGQKDSVSVDDTLLVRFGLSTAWPITSVLQLTLGAGFQFPIMKADASSHGGPLQDLDLQSFFVAAGISLAF
jgi:opacity protein-like surface antigen